LRGGRCHGFSAYSLTVELSPEERASLEAEWARGNKWGASLARKRAVATLVSSVVFGLFLVPAMFTLSIRLFLLAMLAGLPLALLVRLKLTPRSQFDR
jgi:hypothetical protein